MRADLLSPAGRRAFSQVQGIHTGTGAIADRYQLLCANCHGKNLEGAQAPLAFYRNADGPHFGGRPAFDRTGHPFLTIGERGDGTNTQKLDRSAGKILHLLDDGWIRTDNPFVHEPGAAPAIWSYDHHNPQGLAFDPATAPEAAISHSIQRFHQSCRFRCDRRHA